MSNQEVGGPLEDTQSKITAITEAIAQMLRVKNQRYGNSAFEPVNIFSKEDSVNSIKIRLDDKLQRVKNSEHTRINDVCDIIGYSILLLISIGCTVEDIHKQID